MHRSDITRIADQCRAKAAFLEGRPFGYVILSALAGVYLGFGITLIFSVGAPFAAGAPAGLKLIMGCAFGMALAFVLFAGAELFTGNNLVCAVGALDGAITCRTAGRIWLVSFMGNLIGSLGLAWLVAQSGVLSHAPQIDFVIRTAAMKMSLPGWELFVRGILCNWLVCLSVWMAGRMSSEAAKLVIVFWCLLAFVGSGFEHSIANQSLLGLALLHPHPDTVSWSGFLWNQTWVVMGNVVGGSVFVGGLYWLTVAPIPVSQGEAPAAAVSVQART